jgi:hypothetical protein
LMVFRNQRRRREMFFNKFQYSWTEQLVSLWIFNCIYKKYILWPYKIRQKF